MRFPSILSITQNSPPCKLAFLMHTDLTAITTESIKIVSNKAKDNQVLLEPSYGKNWTNFLANLIYM